MDLYCDPVDMTLLGSFIGCITGYTAAMEAAFSFDIYEHWTTLLAMDAAVNGCFYGGILGSTLGNIMNHK